MPFIIFGDHTRIIKYVDFPFIVGADGTKVLKPTNDYHPKFYCFALLSLNIPSCGYNRHFTLLKEKTILKPPIEVQRKIAAVLSTVQNAIETQAKKNQKLEELFRTLLHQLMMAEVRVDGFNLSELEKLHCEVSQ
ncbi:MAG: restriction endonuclease subunit S [Nitrospirota bacterium]